MPALRPLEYPAPFRRAVRTRVREPALGEG
ncbi:hypothetical protein SAMN04489716_0131 [Actinoplanes derwentensis]|uniref:Uncharacterized protein n=1 Tax=Actinoplanes derwentensis TaxID=113562 RepID=A0A1H1PW51_9ACTN|nr:hypothetical protein SAMN04489716_0131 [Actinoplanes derwentensis]